MKNKKKIWKFIGAGFGLVAMACIIPACVVSCGSSTNNSNPSSANNSNPPSQTNLNYIYHPTLLKTIIDGGNKSDYQIDANTVIANNEAKATDWSSSQLNVVANSINALAINSSLANPSYGSFSNPYTFGVDVPANLLGATFNWYWINTDNVLLANGIQDATSKNANMDYIQYLIKNYGTSYANAWSSSASKPNASWNELSSSYNCGNNGYMFICEIINGNNIYYSQAIWLETLIYNNPNIPTVDFGTGNPTTTPTYNLVLNNKGLNKQTNQFGNVSYYLPNDKTVLNFSLQLLNPTEFKSGYNEYTWSLNNNDFDTSNNINDYVQYTVYSNGSSRSTNWLPLNKLSSWSFSTVIQGSGHVSVYFESTINGITNYGATASSANINYNFEANYANISWDNGAKVAQGNSNSISTIGYCWYEKLNYNWQISTNDGKTWTDIAKQSGSIVPNNNSLSSIPTYNLSDVDNSTNQYRLMISNPNDSSQVFYSNVITENDSLITPTIEFVYNKTTTNAKNVEIALSLTQYDKTLNDESQLANLSGTLNINNSAYLTIKNLASYYDVATKQIIFTIPMSEVASICSSSNYSNALFTFILNKIPLVILLKLLHMHIITK